MGTALRHISACGPLGHIQPATGQHTPEILPATEVPDHDLHAFAAAPIGQLERGTRRIGISPLRVEFRQLPHRRRQRLHVEFLHVFDSRVHHVPEGAGNGAAPAVLRGDEHRETLTGEDLERVDRESLGHGAAIAHVTHRVELRREHALDPAVRHGAEAQGQGVAVGHADDLIRGLELVAAQTVHHEHIGADVVEGKALHRGVVRGDLQIAEQQGHVAVISRSSLPQRAVGPRDEDHAVHPHRQMQRGGHVAVIQERSGMGRLKRIHRGLTGDHHERGRGHAIVGLVHVEAVQVDGVAFRARVGEVQIDLLALVVAQQRSGQGDESIGHPSIAPDGYRRSVIEEVDPVHLGEQHRRQGLGMQPRRAAGCNQHQQGDRAPHRREMQGIHGAMSRWVIMPPG